LDIQKLVRQAGYVSVQEYMKERVFPALIVTVSCFLITLFFFKDSGIPAVIIPFVILIGGLAYPPLYLKSVVENKKTNIHENIHLFITYVGAIASLDISRVKVFTEASKKEEYGEITETVKKIRYLAKDWDLGFAKTCRKVASLEPSIIFSEFLDRLAAALDFGEPLDLFLLKEQKAVMEEYEMEYRKSLEWMNTLRDMYSSLLIAGAFIFVASILMPFFLPYSVETLIILTALFLATADVCIYVMVESFIPKAQMCHKLKIKDAEHKRMMKHMRTMVLICPAIFLTMSLIGIFSYSVNLALAITPLGYIGFLGAAKERAVSRRDNEFPGFIRSLGGSLSAKGGSMVTTLEALRVHEFGVLNYNIEMLYRRLKLGTDKIVTWAYFSGESGSQLIYEFCNIFVDVTKLGGDPEKACEIISENFSRLLHLRKLRAQLSGSLRGMFYGSILALSLTVYAGLQSIKIISGTISSMTNSVSDAPMAKEMLGNIFLSPDTFNIPLITGLVFTVLVFQSAFTAYLIKVIDGGEKYACLMDLVVLTWTIVAIEYLASYVASTLL
jgi:flagellar protein FlaJ